MMGMDMELELEIHATSHSIGIHCIFCRDTLSRAGALVCSRVAGHSVELVEEFRSAGLSIILHHFAHLPEPTQDIHLGCPGNFIPGGSANSHPGSSSCRFSYPQVPVPFPAPGPRPSRPTIWRYLLCTPGLFPFLRIPSLTLLCLPFSHLRAPGRVLNHELVFWGSCLPTLWLPTLCSRRLFCGASNDRFSCLLLPAI